MFIILMNEQGADPVWNDIKTPAAPLWKRIAAKVERKAYGWDAPGSNDADPEPVEGLGGEFELTLKSGEKIKGIVMVQSYPGSSNFVRVEDYNGHELDTEDQAEVMAAIEAGTLISLNDGKPIDIGGAGGEGDIEAVGDEDAAAGRE